MMNSELDKGLFNLFEQDQREFPSRPFIRETLMTIEYSDKLFRRLKVCIASLMILVGLILAPWISNAFTLVSKMIWEILYFISHSLFSFAFSPLALTSVLLLFPFYSLLAKLRIIRLF